MNSPPPTERWSEPHTYERLSAELQRKNAALLGASCAGPQPAEHALDAGCGTGVVAEELLQRGCARAVTCLDVSPDMLALARSKPALRGQTFACASLLDMPDEAAFDLIASNAALHWLYPRYPETFARLRRLARAGARLRVAVAGRCAASDQFDDALAQAFRAVGRSLDPVPFKERRLRPADAAAHAAAAGFQVEDVFLLERRLQMPLAEYADWLIASGGPWTDPTPAHRAALCDALVRHLGGGDTTIDVGHWSTFLFAHA